MTSDRAGNFSLRLCRVLACGVAVSWICAAPVKAQRGGAGQDASNWFAGTAAEADRMLAELAKMRIRPDTTADGVAGVVRKAASLLDRADQRLANDLRDLERERAGLKPRQRSRANVLASRRSDLLGLRCRLALLRGDLYNAAALALPNDPKARAGYLTSAISTFRSLRIEYVALPLSLMGYLGEGRSQRLSGRTAEAEQALGPLLQMRVAPRDEVAGELRRTAMLEQLEIRLVADPGRAIRQATTWGGSRDLAKRAIWRARVNWVLSRAFASEAERLKEISDTEASAALTKSANLLREEELRGVVPVYDRLELLARLDALDGKGVMTRNELLQWADALAATGNTDAADFYRRCDATPGPPLSGRQQYGWAALLWKKGDLPAAADTCDSLLDRLPADHSLRPDAIRLRAAVLTKLYHGTAPPKRSSRLSARFSRAVEPVIAGEFPEPVRRDALRQWVAATSRRVGFGPCTGMLTNHPKLVNADPYLLYARAASRWVLLSAESSAAESPGAAALAHQALGDCEAAQSAARRAGANPLAGRSAILAARILAAAPLNDPQKALRTLDEAADILTGEQEVEKEAKWVRVELLLDLGLTASARAQLPELSQAGSAGSPPGARPRLLLRMAEAIADRYDKSDPQSRQAIVNLCNRALAAALRDESLYPAIAERSARVMLRVGAHGHAEGILKRLLALRSVQSDRVRKLGCSLMLAEALQEGGQIGEGRQQLERLTREFPQSPAAHMAMGRTQMILKRPGSAVACFRRARKLCTPGSVAWCEATLALAEGLHADGHTAAAADVLRVTAALYPRFGHPELLMKLKKLTERVRSALRWRAPEREGAR